MRAKSLLAGITSIVALSVIILNLSQPRPTSLHSWVSATHRQLKDNLQNIKDKLDNIGLDNENAVDGDDNTDEKYLELIGLGSSSTGVRFYTSDTPPAKMQVFVSYVSRSTVGEAIGLARNLAHYLHSYSLVIYNLGITREQLQQLASFCNNTKCGTVDFDLSRFPPHVSDENLHAFRPLIIQDAVSRHGAVFYLENDQRICSQHVLSLFARAQALGGLLTWRSARPVTAQTHPKMINMLNSGGAPEDSLYFTPMVEPSRLIVFNKKDLSRKLMLPWVKCSLQHDCILPVGAQSVGCRFDKKPVYRYSGCHWNDASALSVLLGLLYQFEPDRYSIRSEAIEGQESSGGPTEEPLFRVVGPAEAALELSSLLDNSTDSSTTL